MSPLPPSAQRMDRIQPFHVMELLARTRQLEAQGRDIVHMEIGEPDFPTPEPIVRAAAAALAQGRLYYTPALGLPALRAAIAQFYADSYGVGVPAERIAVTTGGSGALLLSLAVLIDPGDAVMLADPGYPCNRNFVHFLGGEVQAVPVDATTAYQLTPELVERHWTPRTKAVLLASPANPTGTLVPREDLARIAALTAAHGAALIVDEIYHGLVYGGQAPTALAAGEGVFVVNSFSKYFNMTGWRIGWLVSPAAYIGDVNKLAQNLYLAAPTLGQYAALAAFEPESRAILEARRDEFRRRRDYLLPALRELGFSIPVTPQGAFYLYAGCERFGADSEALALRLLEEAGVAITPGRDFGDNAPERHMRFAYTTSLDKLQEGVARLRAHLTVA